MSVPLISVVIPAHNAAGFINRTLDSLKAQTFKSFEVVAVDDGSSDNTADLIAGYARLNPDIEIRLLRQENKGIAAARNYGIRQARAGLIAFLDHDDIWYPDKLKRCLSFMQERPGADLVCHNELMRSPSGEAVRTLSYGPYQEDMFRKLFFQGNCLSTSATVARIQALKEVGLFRGNSLYLEDYDLWLRLSKNHRIAFIPDILGEYILHDTNISKDVVWHQKSQINVLKKNFKEFSGRKITDYLRFFLRLSRLYLSIIKNSLFYD